MSNQLPRWVCTVTCDFAHLDLGERSRQSLYAFAEHIVVAACRAQLAPTTEVVPDEDKPRCPDCQRIGGERAASTRHRGAIDAVPRTFSSRVRDFQS